jgi:exosortase/archaeosortase family protein
MERLKNILFRYGLLALVALSGLGFFYWIFSPLTVYPVFSLFDIFFDPVFCGDCGANTILIDNFQIEIIGSCIAGSAYLFLLILNLVTPKIKISKRLKMIGSGFLAFLIMNILRIFIMGLMYIYGSSWFDFAHKFVWYIGTTVFVILVWFIQVKYFKIKGIPFYSDIKYLYSGTKKKS